MFFSNYLIAGSRKKPILYDVRYEADGKAKPIIIFCHGFKGFKDWGHFNLISEFFARNGFIFVKFNFSFNGTTPGKPTEFVDLEAFAQNNLTTELDDLGLVINEVLINNTAIPFKEKDPQKIYLIGHSRGGGIAILKTFEDQRVKKLCTWASIDDFKNRYSVEELKSWKEIRVTTVPNSRTGQNLPLDYQIIEDYDKNRKRLDILSAATKLKTPFFILHGSKDESVNIEAAQYLKTANPKAQIKIIEGADHTFGGKHPFEEESLPAYSQQLVEATLEFLKA